MSRQNGRNKQTRKKKGGGQETHTSTTQSIAYPQYGLPAGASSQREAALSKTSTMNANQQSMIDAHGGRRRRGAKTKKGKKAHKRRTLKANRRSRVRRGRSRKARRMQGGDQTGQTVTVPSFSNSGSSVSSINANSMSQTSNSTNLVANSQAGNDCYATGTCAKQSGGFSNGKRSRKRRAGKRVKWGCMSGGLLQRLFGN